MPFLVKCAWISGDWKVREDIWATRRAAAGAEAAEVEDGWIWMRAIFTMVEEIQVDVVGGVDSGSAVRARAVRSADRRPLLLPAISRHINLAGRNSK